MATNSKLTTVAPQPFDPHAPVKPAAKPAPIAPPPAPPKVPAASPAAAPAKN